MFGLKQQANLEIDTMGREYNRKKDLIALPENAEDEIYAGEYFPRRYTSRSLSLEYLDNYMEKALPKSIALVTGIYGSAAEADSGLKVMRRYSPKAFVVETELYLGCMH